jgi:two-component system response regulator FixJ
MTRERIVHVIDDEAAVRRSLERLLHAAGFATTSYETPTAFLEVAAGLSDGCILLDVRMPGMDGLMLQGRLHELGISLPVIVMTGASDVRLAVRAMKAGAVDFLEKPFDDQVLIQAVESALKKSGGIVRNHEIIDAARRVARLTPREREVLDALVAGRPNKVIAFDLGISVRTVEVHRAHMMERLGVRQLAEAIRLAVMARMGTGLPKAARL